jgi:hypothetical protein
MVVTTTVTLGCRETPRFVPREFYDCVQLTSVVNQFDCSLHPDTIRYFIPSHQVIERMFEPCQEYCIEVDDSRLVPRCLRRNVIKKEIMTLKTPSRVFDRLDVSYEFRVSSYFLLLPNASYYHTEIWREWNTSHIMYNGVIWNVHFRHVYTDPHNTTHCLWFSGKPKYQVQITVGMDFRNNRKGLQTALLAILPRAFKWDTDSGASFETL